MALFSRLLFYLVTASSFFGVYGAPGATAPSDSVDVTLKTGTFRGLSGVNGTDAWLGIPYAQPPVGPLRFKAPVPITDTTTEIQYAYSFGDACPQPASSSLGANISEDCLNLNVWRPSGTPADAKLPVLVWHYVSYFLRIARWSKT